MAPNNTTIPYRKCKLTTYTWTFEFEQEPTFPKWLIFINSEVCVNNRNQADIANVILKCILPQNLRIQA